LPLSFTIFIGNIIALSQDKLPVIFGKVTPKDFDLPNSTAIDSNSNAVIIADVGSIEFVGNNRIRVSYLFKKNIRIKILTKKGYDLTTVKIRLFGQGDWQDKMNDLHASTYNIENGKVVENKLDNSDLFNEKISNNVNEKKFTMSNVREESIIEYSYSITSYHYNYLPGWFFQNLSHPCLYSEYRIAIPNWLKYLILHYGVDSFYRSKSTESYKSFIENNYGIGTVVSNQTWIMKDIPAFKYEDYINNPVDYLNRVEFALSQTYDKKNVNNITKSWKSEEDDLLADDQFGGAINVDNASNLKKTMKNICSSGGDIIDAARQIFSYVRDNFTCVSDDNIYIENDLYDINKGRKGSVSELNMLMIALLRQRGIKADPVILSTREYGMHPSNYPILEKLNYVICLVRAGKDTVYLDASDPMIGFGKLPLSCYNGHAQIIDEQHSGSLFFYPNSIKEQNKTFVTIVNDENGNGSSGSLEKRPGYFGSYDLRTIIKEKGEDKYLKNIQTTYGSDVEIKDLQIDSLNQLEQPVKISYDINFKTLGDDNIIYFNPFISNEFRENPFKATLRKYPIEMPYPLDDTYELTMDIPKGYKVDELPKSVKVSFNGTDGFFEYTIQKDEFMVQLRSHVKLNMAIFAPEDYNSLRDFFAYVVKKQSEQIVFKKK